MLSRLLSVVAAATLLLSSATTGDAASKKNYKADRGTPPCLTWQTPEAEPRAVLLCVHGCGLHNGSFKDFGEAMSKRGIVTYAVDVRGFGSFQEKPGSRAIDLDGCLWDVAETLRVLHKAYPTLSIYLLGESMGGAIALRATAENPELVQGLIASVPAGDRFKQYRTDLRVAFHAITGGFHHDFKIGTSIINQSTKKPELAKEWREDPLSRMKLSPLDLLQFDRFCAHNNESAKKVATVPVLYVQGCKDHLIKPESTYRIFHNTATDDKWLLQIGNAEHLIFEEHQFNDAIVDMVTRWIDQPAPKKIALDLGSPTGCTEAVAPKAVAPKEVTAPGFESVSTKSSESAEHVGGSTAGDAKTKIIEVAPKAVVAPGLEAEESKVDVVVPATTQTK